MIHRQQHGGRDGPSILRSAVDSSDRTAANESGSVTLDEIVSGKKYELELSEQRDRSWISRSIVKATLAILIGMVALAFLASFTVILIEYWQLSVAIPLPHVTSLQDLELYNQVFEARQKAVDLILGRLGDLLKTMLGVITTLLLSAIAYFFGRQHK